MVLGIAEDFTTNVSLDAELQAVPVNGLYLNSGVHPCITLENLLAFLPYLSINISEWNEETTYGRYSQTRNRADLVLYDDVLYQSIATDNTNHLPNEDDSNYWMETNLDALRLKSFIQRVQDKVYAELNLTHKLINNQYLYEIGRTEVPLPNNYAAWVFEAKGSDYAIFRINQISFQSNAGGPVNLYVINQGNLIETIHISPSPAVSFQDVNYTFSGPGQWIFAIDSTAVFVSGKTIDPQKYNGFVVYTATGIGDAPETAAYSYSTSGNGLGFNITVYLDASRYIENNVNEFGNFIRACFEYMVFQMFLHNPNNVSNRQQRIQMNDELLELELKNLNGDTVALRYMQEKRKAIKQLQRTFDTQLSNDHDEIDVEIAAL